MTPTPRDPAALPRLGGTLVALVVLWPLLRLTDFRPAALFDAGTLRPLGQFLLGFLPPAHDPDFLALLGRATLETLAMATAGVTVAFVLAVPLGLAMTRSLSVSRLADRRDRGTGAVLRALTRGVLTVLRGIPELVWALLFVRIFGLGPAAGVLALGITYGGMLGKVYGEILDSVDARPARSLLEAGSGRLAALGYGLLPNAAQELVSYTVYRWECAVRASVVMGFVGAGGLGQLMDQAMKMLNGGEAATILLTFMVLVFSADGLSGWLRRALDTPPAARPSPFGWRSGLVGAAIVAGIVASFRLLDIGFGALFTGEAARSIGEFIAGFFPPDLSADWLARVGKGVWETLAISVVGTLLAAGAGLLLALPKWRAPFSFLLNTLPSH